MAQWHDRSTKYCTVCRTSHGEEVRPADQFFGSFVIVAGDRQAGRQIFKEEAICIFA